MFGKRFSRALVVTAAASLVLAAAAFGADAVNNDQDFVTNGNQSTIAKGTQTRGVQFTASASLRLEYAGNQGHLTPGSTVVLELDPVASSAGVAAGDLSFNVPATWTDGSFVDAAAPSTISYTPGATEPEGDHSLTVKWVCKTNCSESGGNAATLNTAQARVTVTYSLGALPTGDTTAPVIAITTPANGAVYLLNQVVNASYTCTDNESTVTQCAGTVANGSAIDTSSVGAKSFTVNAASAGGTSSLTHNYSVIFDWDGFFSPVNNLPDWNSAKAGQSIPLKFSLGGDQGLGILDGAPRIYAIACPSDPTQADPIEEYATTTANSKLIYDAGQYNYVWKTEKAWAGKCFRLDVKLIDGTTHSARFNFTK